MPLLDNPQPDLSLEELRFFVTLMQTRSLTAAAHRHGMSMASASRRLARLREALDDELFVRSGAEMVPTARTRDLLPRVLDLLAAGASLLPRGSAELSEVRRTVRILSVDGALISILPEAVRRITREAPHVTVDIRSIGPDLFEQLRSGSADIALYPLPAVPKDFHVLELYRSRRGVLVREGHPLLARYEETGRITLEDLRPYRHITMNFEGASDFSPALYRQYGFETVVTLPYFTGAPAVIRDTDFVYLAPVAILMPFLRMPQLGLRMLPAPDDIASFTPALLWHHATHTDPFLQWVRAVIVQNAREEARRFNAVE